MNRIHVDTSRAFCATCVVWYAVLCRADRRPHHHRLRRNQQQREAPVCLSLPAVCVTSALRCCVLDTYDEGGRRKVVNFQYTRIFLHLPNRVKQPTVAHETAVANFKNLSLPFFVRHNRHHPRPKPSRNTVDCIPGCLRSSVLVRQSPSTFREAQPVFLAFCCDMLFSLLVTVPRPYVCTNGEL